MTNGDNKKNELSYVIRGKIKEDVYLARLEKFIDKVRSNLTK